MIHDSKMPKGWHTIKSVLLTELRTAANFHLCEQAAGALFHARLLGESIAKEWAEITPEAAARVAPQEEA